MAQKKLTSFFSVSDSDSAEPQPTSVAESNTTGVSSDHDSEDEHGGQ